jgi:2-dehydro-3-deoxyphosphogluconate aldolase/(4S)-4-hydroxy-2-oxoglutarate aldolase
MPTMTRPPLPAGIVTSGVIAIGRRLESGVAETVADALRDGGVGAFELTLNEPVGPVLDAIRRLATRFSGPDFVVGAGTVLSMDAARRAVDSGAGFLVSPHTDPAIVEWAAAQGVPILPGAFTATEALNAWTAGASAVKLFPASVLGAAGLRELRGPLPDIPFIPTGGVRVETVADFVAAGAVAIGAGSWLIGEGEAGRIGDRGRQLVEAVREGRTRAAGRAGS